MLLSAPGMLDTRVWACSGAGGASGRPDPRVGGQAALGFSCNGIPLPRAVYVAGQWPAFPWVKVRSQAPGTRSQATRCVFRGVISPRLWPRGQRRPERERSSREQRSRQSQGFLIRPICSGRFPNETHLCQVGVGGESWARGGTHTPWRAAGKHWLCEPRLSWAVAEARAGVGGGQAQWASSTWRGWHCGCQGRGGDGGPAP